MELVSFNSNTTITHIHWQAYPIAFILVILCLFTVLGNLLIICAIVYEKTLHASKYYYIASLAFADLLVGLIVMPFAFVFEMTDDEYWLFMKNLRFFCDFWHSMDIFASTASIFGLSAIGIDRYVAITRPIQYSDSFICKRWYYILIFTWICSAAMSFPAVIHLKPEHIFSHHTLDSTSECNFPDNPYYILFVSIVSFYLPLIVMIYVYIRVYSVAKQQAQALRSGYKRQHSKQILKSFVPRLISTKTTIEKSQTLITDRRSSIEIVTLRIHRGAYQQPNLNASHSETKNTRRKTKFWKKMSQDQKAEKFVGLVMGAFVFCWLPYFIYFLLSGVFNIRLKDEHSHELLFKILSWLGYTNSALDVLVYIFTSNELRRKVFKLSCK